MIRRFPSEYLMYTEPKALPITRDLSFETRSLYRGLLRASSYLPDSAARQYADARIKARFRVNCAKAKGKADKKIPGTLKTVGQSATKVAITSGKRAAAVGKLDDFTIQRLKKGRSTKTLLENASNGDIEALVKVLKFVYGRQGERKRVLLQDLLRPEDGSPGNTSAIKRLVATGSPDKGYWPDAKLYRFIKDQQENQPPEVHKGKIRNPRPKVPEENLWGRPLALRQRESFVRKWWASTLERLLPPIPRNEWERLRDLAVGAVPLEEQPQRRARAISLSLSLDKETAKKMTNQQILKYFRMPARVPKPDIDRVRFELDNGLVILPNATIEEVQSSRQELRDRMLRKWRDGTDEKKARKEIPARSMRRIYASILSLTPTMEYNKITKTWDIEWGRPKSPANAGVITQASPGDMELFEGIEKFDQNVTIEASRIQRPSTVDGKEGAVGPPKTTAS
ncbi:hypothetical protein QTJ16_002307 [Diplocarpon rosae]|uniref:LYR motif-containing protein Cup1-like N-terminal domain-containing protein n=1 Tax=Diplocarpon rosae TaxID=946125 RepID=A0AAD9WFU6_9HELO|nr:hypothetical protein QTJ16_002307 [Diplocarpon rosae]